MVRKKTVVLLTIKIPCTQMRNVVVQLLLGNEERPSADVPLPFPSLTTGMFRGAKKKKRKNNICELLSTEIV